MTDYIEIFQDDSEISVTFIIEYDEILAIGNKMEEINENAYMNGYNWEAFFYSYLEQNAPELLEDYDTDSEAGTFVAFYPATTEGERQAKKLAKLIESLVENEEMIYQFIRDYGDDIEWD